MVQKKTYYCGTKKLPAGKRQGTQRECAASKQLRLYGLLQLRSNGGLSLPYVPQGLSAPRKRKAAPKKKKTPTPPRPKSLTPLVVSTANRPKRQRRKTAFYGF